MTNSNTMYPVWWPARVHAWTAALCCIAMIGGLLFSRALLSVSMVLLCVNALHPATVRTSWRVFKKDRFAHACILFLFTYIISGLWSEDKENWAVMLQIKAPFLFLPFAMYHIPLRQVFFLKMIIAGILLLLFSGIVYSVLPLLSDPDLLLHRDHLPSPVEGDYIRFTMALVLGLLPAGLLLRYRGRYGVTGPAAALLVAWMIVAVAYVHFQAAKSGLLSFYILSGVLLLYYFGKRSSVLAWILIPLMLVAGTGAVLLVPSLRRQADNLLREQKVWAQQDTKAFSTTASLVPRLLSYRIACDLIAAHPLLGLGAGDMKAGMDREYMQKYPDFPATARLLPHNQFLCAALATGVPLSLSLVWMALAPLHAGKRRLMATATALIMLAGLMIEPSLETQYGIFLYLFFTVLSLRLDDAAAAPER